MCISGSVMYSALKKYSPPLNVSTFCHVLTTNVNVFYWDFMWNTNTKWCIIVKWKENDTWFYIFFTNKKKTEKCGIHPPSQYFVEPPFAAMTAASFLG